MPFITGKSPQIKEDASLYHGSSAKERAETCLGGWRSWTENAPAFPPLQQSTCLVTPKDQHEGKLRPCIRKCFTNHKSVSLLNRGHVIMQHTNLSNSITVATYRKLMHNRHCHHNLWGNRESEAKDEGTWLIGLRSVCSKDPDMPMH